MIRNFYKVILCAFVMSAGFVSCNKDDNEVFSELPSVREKERAKELKELLLSSEKGWKLTYFTDDSELGGFTFLMRFAESGKVEMISDFNTEGYQLQVSDYDIQLRGTTSLVFVTENKLHKLSDPYDSPTSQSLGFKGEFQWRFYSSSENEIEFRGTKEVSKVIRLVKATDEDWAGFDKRQPVLDFYNDINKPIFKTLELRRGNGSVIYDGVLGMRSRFFDFNNSNEDFGEASKGFGIGYTNKGAIISPAITIEGKEYKEFQWDATRTELVSINDGDVKIAIRNASNPVSWDPGYKAVVSGTTNTKMMFFTNDAIMYGQGTSELFLKAITDENEQPILDGFSLKFNKNYLEITYEVNGNYYWYEGNLKDENGRLTFIDAIWFNEAPAEIKEMNEKIFPKEGFFLKRQNYKVKYSNIVHTIYSGNNTVSFDIWEE